MVPASWVLEWMIFWPWGSLPSWAVESGAFPHCFDASLSENLSARLWVNALVEYDWSFSETFCIGIRVITAMSALICFSSLRSKAISASSFPFSGSRSLIAFWAPRNSGWNFDRLPWNRWFCHLHLYEWSTHLSSLWTPARRPLRRWLPLLARSIQFWEWLLYIID